MYVSLVPKPFANNSLIVGIEVGNTRTKGLNMYYDVIRKALTHVHALQFFGNKVSNQGSY